MILLPDLLAAVVSFLDPEDRAKCSFFSGGWGSACRRVEEEEIRDWISQLESKRRRRTSQRRTLLRRQLEGRGEEEDEEIWTPHEFEGPSLDFRLSCELEKILGLGGGHSSDKILLGIIALLDRGAIASYSLQDLVEYGRIYVDEMVCENFFGSSLMGNFECDIVKYLFRILTEFIASPCTSWRFRGGNGLVEFPFLIIEYILFGRRMPAERSRRGKEEQVATFQQRWEAWKVFRSMVHMARRYESEGADFGAFCSDCVGTRYFFLYPCSLWPPWLSRDDHYFIRLYHDFMLPLAPRALSTIVRTSPLLYFMYHSYVAKVPEIPKPDLDWVLKEAWRTRTDQRRLRRFFARNREFRLSVMDHCLKPLCKRKDRKTLELLVKLEPLTVIAKIPTILSNLNQAQGKKERLMAYFMSMDETRCQRQVVLEEIRARKSYDSDAD